MPPAQCQCRALRPVVANNDRTRHFNHSPSSRSVVAKPDGLARIDPSPHPHSTPERCGEGRLQVPQRSTTYRCGPTPGLSTAARTIVQPPRRYRFKAGTRAFATQFAPAACAPDTAVISSCLPTPPGIGQAPTWIAIARSGWVGRTHPDGPSPRVPPNTRQRLHR